MAATITGMSLWAPTTVAVRSNKIAASRHVAMASPWGLRRRHAGVAMAAPDKLSEKVAESIKGAEEACSDDPASGECVAAWDEVEELSAAASHARDKAKAVDPLEEYCKDNPEVEECRTYED